MNRAQLLIHFDRISEAPDAVPRLRRLILDLAVRGKLVEQDPNDERSSELLNRLQAAKARLVKRGGIRNPREVEPNYDENEIFTLPPPWAWCRLLEVGAIVGGGTPPSADADNFTNGGSGIAWLTPADLGKHTGLYVSHGARDLTPQGFRSSSATLMPKGSVLFTSRAPIGYTAIAENDISTNQGFKSVVPFIPACNLYIAVYFRAFRAWIQAKASGTTFREVSGKIVANLPFPLPPLSEQHRIVAKVDELMVLCDRLEAAQTERESRRDRVAAASLHRLNNGADAESFRDHARFHLRHLARLTTRPEHIQQLRQTILNLAVRGRLVAQDPKDEPAESILRRIHQARVRLYAEKKIPKPKDLPRVEDLGIPFVIPVRWNWTMLGMLCYQVSDGPHYSPSYVSRDEGVPFLSTRNVRLGGFDLTDLKYVSRKDHEEFCKRIRPEKGDILYTKGGTTGIARVNDLDFEFSVWVHLAVLRVAKKFLEPRYIELALNSPLCYEQSQAYTQGISNFDLGLTRMIKIVIPLPPLAEQHRIVAKVDQLMALCDQLEAQLTTTQSDSRRLLEAVLRDALAPALAQAA